MKLGTLQPSVGLIVVVTVLAPSAGAANLKAKSHPSQRPLPTAMNGALTRGPAFGGAVLRINGIKHVRIEGLVLRGTTGSPMVHVYVYRNVFDQRAGVYYGLPSDDDPSGGFLHHEGPTTRRTHSPSSAAHRCSRTARDSTNRAGRRTRSSPTRNSRNWQAPQESPQT